MLTDDEEVRDGRKQSEMSYPKMNPWQEVIYQEYIKKQFVALYRKRARTSRNLHPSGRSIAQMVSEGFW